MLVAVVPLHAIRAEADYGKTAAMLNQLLDVTAAGECSALTDLAGSLIADYEDAKNPPQEIDPLVTLRFLMEPHQLTQFDLSEVGGQGVVSEVLRGKRELNFRQIMELAIRFHVPSEVFI